MSTPVIRLATTSDLERINAIYNHFVLTCTCTYQEVPDTLEDRARWFAAHGKAHPVTVAEVDGVVLGWGSLSHFHPRSAFRFTVENSIYIDPNAQGKGLGRLMMADLIQRATQLGHTNIVAAIDSLQTGSVILHEKFGFQKVGHLKRVGFKFNRWLDMIYLQLPLQQAG